MKNITALIVALTSFSLSYAQIQVGVWTDRGSYAYGDTIAITVTAYNPTTDTVVLHFPSACQVSYTIDRLNLIDSIGCAAILTSAAVPPVSIVQWNFLRYPWGNTGWPALAPGSHAITGEVLGYGRSDTLVIFVTPSTAVSSQTTAITSFSLNQNYPNPFNPSTEISFAIPQSVVVSVKVWNALGQQVACLVDGRLAAGEHRITWVASNLPSGVYFCRLQAGALIQTRKLILVR